MNRNFKARGIKMTDRRLILGNTKRIVIKVGTSTLTYDTGKVNFTRIDKLTRCISDLVNQGKEVVLVTSGAIGIGMGKLNLSERPKTTGEKQAVASVGQSELMHIYSKFFAEYGHIVGQILLTKNVVEEDDTRKNVINTFENLLKKSIIPIVNENDSVSTYEIKNIKNFGDNDTLSAVVSEIVKADLLIILSDIDGLYDKDPHSGEECKLIPVIKEISSEIDKIAGGAGTKRGTGGMATKISAARIATAAGVNMVIANGSDPEVIMRVVSGENEGSLFLAKGAK